MCRRHRTDVWQIKKGTLDRVSLLLCVGCPRLRMKRAKHGAGFDPDGFFGWCYEEHFDPPHTGRISEMEKLNSLSVVHTL